MFIYSQLLICAKGSDRDQPADADPAHLRPLLRPHGPAAAQAEHQGQRHLAEAAQGDQEPDHGPLACRLSQVPHQLRGRKGRACQRLCQRPSRGSAPGGGGRSDRQGSDRCRLHGQVRFDLQLPAVGRVNLLQVV